MQSNELAAIELSQQMNRTSSDENISTPCTFLNVVVQKIDGTAELHRVPFEATATGCRVFEQLKAEIINRRMPWIIRLLCFLGLMSVTAHIAEYNLDNDVAESQLFPSDVFIQNRRPHRTFTDALTRPTLLEPMNQFIVQHRHLTTSSPLKNALVFRLVVNGMGVFWVLVASFITAPLLGTLVGFLYRPDVGMETTIVIFAMIPALGMLGAWIQGFDSSVVR